MNLFVKGIKPAWEDTNNAGGKVLTLEYEVKKELDKFLVLVNHSWIKLLVYLIGEQIPSSNHINGIRFVDKTQFGKGIIFRFEVWINKSMVDKDKLEELKSFLSKNFGCSGIKVKNLE